MTGSEPEIPDVEPVMVVLDFESDDLAGLLDILAAYVVATRGEPGCRNIDLVASSTRPGRVLVIQKWDSASAQQAHFADDVPGSTLATMAQAVVPILRRDPDIDLFDGVSMHDLD